MARAVPCQGTGRGFEPLNPLHKNTNATQRVAFLFLLDRVSGTNPLSRRDTGSAKHAAPNLPFADNLCKTISAELYMKSVFTLFILFTSITNAEPPLNCTAALTIKAVPDLRVARLVNALKAFPDLYLLKENEKEELRSQPAWRSEPVPASIVLERRDAVLLELQLRGYDIRTYEMSNILGKENSERQELLISGLEVLNKNPNPDKIRIWDIPSLQTYVLLLGSVVTAWSDSAGYWHEYYQFMNGRRPINTSALQIIWNHGDHLLDRILRFRKSTSKVAGYLIQAEMKRLKLLEQALTRRDTHSLDLVRRRTLDKHLVKTFDQWDTDARERAADERRNWFHVVR